MLQAIFEGCTLHNLPLHHDVELAFLGLALRKVDREPLAEQEDDNDREKEADAVDSELAWLSLHFFLEKSVSQQVRPA